MPILLTFCLMLLYFFFVRCSLFTRSNEFFFAILVDVAGAFCPSKRNRNLRKKFHLLYIRPTACGVAAMPLNHNIGIFFSLYSQITNERRKSLSQRGEKMNACSTFYFPFSYIAYAWHENIRVYMYTTKGMLLIYARVWYCNSFAFWNGLPSNNYANLCIHCCSWYPISPIFNASSVGCLRWDTQMALHLCVTMFCVYLCINRK